MRLFLDSRPRLARTLCLSLTGGAVVGLFLARLLAEGAVASWAWEPLRVAGLALLGALAASGCALVPTLYASAEGGPRPARESAVAPLLALLLPALYLLRPGVDPLQARVLLCGTVAALLLLAAGGASLLPATPARRRMAGLATAALLGLPLLVYLQAPSPGVAHVGGSGLYTLLGRLLVLVPLGDAGLKLRLLSPVCATLAVASLYLAISRLSGRRAVALLAALAFAFSPAFWERAVTPGAAALGAFFVATLLYLVLAREQAPGGWRLPALLYGLSLGNDPRMLLLAPALAAAVLWRRGPGVPGRRRQWLAAAGLALAGLSPCLYIPLRQGTPGVAGALAWAGGGNGRAALDLDNWLPGMARSCLVAGAALEQYGWGGAAVAIAGLASLLRKRRRAGLVLLLAWVAYACYALCAPVRDVPATLIPAHLVMAAGIGAGVAALQTWLAARARALVAPCTLLVALLPLSMAWGHWPAMGGGPASRTGLAWGRDVLGLALVEGGTILADGERAALLGYLQAVEGARPDLEVVAMGDEAGDRRRLEERVAAGRPVYLARYVPGLEAAHHLRSLGPLVEVSGEPLLTPAIDHRHEVAFGDTICLLGLNTGALAVARGDAVRLTLFWRAAQAPLASYHVRLRLVGSSGHVWWESSDHPVSGMYPTTAWKGGEVVPDYHEVPIEASLHPGDYRLEVGLFLPFSDEGLPVAEQRDPYLSLAAVRVLDAPAAPLAVAQPMAARFDGRLVLVGCDLPALVRPGAQLPVTLFWRPASPCPDYEIVVEALDEARQVVASAAGPPLHGEYPASRWLPGATVVTEHRLALPAVTGALRLQVSLREPGAAGPVPVEPGWLAPRRQACPLGSVQVEGSAPHDFSLLGALYGTMAVSASSGVPSPCQGGPAPC